MYWISKSIHQVRRLNRRTVLFLAALGPGIITMIADNDAGGISTYAQTGAKTGFNLLWAMIILIPMAYYVQEMTVRLGAVTKRGHAEAIFASFGRFWGWFSLLDLVLTDWLTMITEFIGMTAAMSIFHIPPVITIPVSSIVTPRNVTHGGMLKRLIAWVMPMYSVTSVSQLMTARSKMENQPQNLPKPSKIASA